LSFIYNLPPLPTGDYTVKIITFNNHSNTEIGCLSLQSKVSGLQDQSCGYTSTLSADLAGSLVFVNNTIQIGPWGPSGEDLGYDWGTFGNVQASADLIGANPVDFKSFVWGITGHLNTSKIGSVFEGTFVIGYLPDTSTSSGATLVHQGTFEWQMLQNSQGSSPPYLFQSGTINISPKYAFPANFPYPLILGNLNPFQVTPSGNYFSVTASNYWCTCNCPSDGDSGNNGDQIVNDGGISGLQLSQWRIGTIVVAGVGGVIVIVSLVFIYKLWRRPRRQTIHDDHDILDPQKPDYGAIAIDEIFEDEREYA